MQTRPLHFHGDLTQQSVDTLFQSLRQACGEDGECVELYLDPDARIDSHGLGALIRALKLARDQNRSLLLCQASDETREMLALTGLDQVLPVRQHSPVRGTETAPR